MKAWQLLSFPEMTSLDVAANLEGRGSSGKFEPHFNGENGSEREKILGRVIYASETIQNCKNPTGHMDTLMSYEPKRVGGIRLFNCHF